MSTLAVEKNNKTPFATAIKADASGSLPTQIELLKVGVWRTPYHGDFMITPEDLQEYVDNFVAAIGLADGGSVGAPIDFSHNNENLAAGWITKLTTDGLTLFGQVKWSDAGKQALLGDEFKFFSPEFYPKGRGGWMDPEDYEVMYDNVLVGGGLTNIPLFKTLGALMASANGTREVRVNAEYISANQIKEQSMTVQEQIAEYRKTDVDKLTEEAKAFVTAHATELTDDDKKHFGIEDAGVSATNKNKGDEVVVDKDTAAIAASIKSGEMKVIKASELKALQDSREADKAQIDELRKERISAHVDTALARGAIKADQKDKWVDRIMADATMQEDLDNLPNNALLAGSQGAGAATAGQAVQAAQDELHSKTVEAVKAAADKGTDLSYTAARRQVLASNAELAAKINQDKE